VLDKVPNLYAGANAARCSTAVGEGVLMRVNFAIACLTSCCAANAAPVYFECTISGNDSKATTSYNVMLDEEAGIAVVSGSAQSFESQTVPARFTPSDIRFIAVMPTVKLSVEYRIDRSSFKFSRLVRSGSLRFQYGTCKSAEADGAAAEALGDQAANR
jgi:hypothetical protein